MVTEVGGGPSTLTARDEALMRGKTLVVDRATQDLDNLGAPSVSTSLVMPYPDEPRLLDDDRDMEPTRLTPEDVTDGTVMPNFDHPRLLDDDRENEPVRRDPQDEPDNVLDFGITPATTFSNQSVDQNVNGVLIGLRWTDSAIAYSFPDSFVDDYGSGYADYSGHLGSFSSFDAKQVAAAENWLDQYAAVSGLSFSELDGPTGALDEDQEATLKFANSNVPSTAFAYYPNAAFEEGGDSWYGFAGSDPDLGDYHWLTTGHEIGHAVGLSHGHTSDGGFGAMNSDRDSMEFSIMTYRSHTNDGLDDGYVNDSDSYAQTLMTYDIAAIQFMYGANFDYNSTSTTYTVDSGTGEFFIDGVGQGDPEGDTVFRTVWDGDGANDTYDFSNLATAVDVDLRPGFWSDLDAGGNDMRALLDFTTSPDVYARGHIFNALLHNGDTRSLIENAEGGSGDDDVSGNIASNELSGNAGADYLFGDFGDDDLLGGEGADFLDGWVGDDLLDGGEGDDRLLGYDGVDILDGGAGDDELDGEADADQLTGGAGFDSFTSSAAGFDGDTITDLEPGEEIVFLNETFSKDDILASTGSLVLDIDVDQDGDVETTLTLDGYSADTFEFLQALPSGSDTVIGLGIDDTDGDGVFDFADNVSWIYPTH